VTETDIRDLVRSREALERAGARAAIVANVLDRQLPRLESVVRALGTAAEAPPAPVPDLVSEALEHVEKARGLLEQAGMNWPAMRPDNPREHDEPTD